MPVEFGAFIRNLRQEKGYTLTQLGGLLGIDSGALSKIENGKKRFDVKTLPSLANVFGLNLESLKNEYFSEIIAYDLVVNECTTDVLRLAEAKVDYIKSRLVKQSEIEF